MTRDKEEETSEHALLYHGTVESRNRRGVPWHEMPRLEVREVTKQFPAVRALSGVTLSFDAGEIHGIVGENGAGKSTLMKILSGIERPTSGTVFLGAAPVTLSGVRHALTLGIAMIHQELDVIDELTVAENVFLGSEKRRGPLLDRRAMNVETNALLDRVGASFAATTRVGDLSIAGKQLVEIAKAVSHRAHVLIMDEPTAVLTERETEALFKLIRELRGEGVTVIYISHRLAEIEGLCDRVSVLRDGVLVATLPQSEVSQSKLATLMVGRELQDFYPEKQSYQPGDVLLEATGVSVHDRVVAADLKVCAGEIVGIAGLVGAGRTELAEAIVGARIRSAGTIKVGGAVAEIKSVKDAMQLGIAYVSEDRKTTGLVLGMDIVENTTLANLRKYCKPLIDKKQELEATKKMQMDLDLRAGDLRADITLLSGGNQQKVSLGKWLECRPKVLILDEPTRGVDVGAKREIYNIILRLTGQGVGCVVISSELPEIVGICQRVLVMRDGRIVGELVGPQITEENIMLLAAGVGAA